MYWVGRGEQYEDDPDEPRYEVLDGQQSTISLCEYVDGSFSVDDRYFYNLPSDKQKQILDYELFAFVWWHDPCYALFGGTRRGPLVNLWQPMGVPDFCCMSVASAASYTGRA